MALFNTFMKRLLSLKLQDFSPQLLQLHEKCDFTEELISLSVPMKDGEFLKS